MGIWQTSACAAASGAARAESSVAARAPATVRRRLFEPSFGFVGVEDEAAMRAVLAARGGTVFFNYAFHFAEKM